MNRFELNNIIRKNIRNLVPYSSARDEFKGSADVFLDANESAFDNSFLLGNPGKSSVQSLTLTGSISVNRYPDPLQKSLKEKIALLKNIPAKNIFLGNGSDEAIDLLFRAFCEPGKDNVIICPPTYGMYEVSANINDVKVIKVPLIKEIFQLDTTAILKTVNGDTKLIFVCCPNNPTGNGVKWNDIKLLLDNFKGLVIVDEAYIDFASYNSLIPQLTNYPNLVILQTFSKAWGLAALRVGMAFADEKIISVLNTIKPPYNINLLSQEMALRALNEKDLVLKQIEEIKSEREKVKVALQDFEFVEFIYPSQANFILVKVKDPKGIYKFLSSRKIVVRDRSRVELCEGCLRITIGTSEENKRLIETLKQFA